MFRFSPLQLLLLTVGFCLIFVSVSLKQIAAFWDDYRYPNAVQWQGMRIVPSETQSITLPAEDVLVVKIAGDASARLTLFLRAEDGSTPRSIIQDLCRRDACTRNATSPKDGDGASATYRIGGEQMQIVLMRLDGSNIWVEYKGPPEALSDFNGLISSVTTQLALRRTHPSG
jgi:hypothetical protein